MVMGGGYNLGSAYGRVIIDTSGIDAAMQQAQSAFQRGLSGFSGGLQQLGDSVSRAGASLTALGAPIAAMFGKSVTQFVAFEEAMTNVQAVTGRTAEEMALVEEAIRETSIESRYGATELANAFYDVVGGVSDASQQMDIFSSAVSLAQAGNADLRGSTNALISVMNSYAGSGLTAARASDILTRTVGMGVGTMDEFASAFPSVTGLANQLGISFEDLGTAAAFLTTKGNSASEATTQLSSMMVALIRPNEAMTGALGRLGFTSGRAAIEQLGLVGAFQALARSEGMDAIPELTGRVEALRGVTALTGDEFAGFSDTFVSGIENATAAAENIQMSSLASQFDVLRSRIEETAINISESLVPSLEPLVEMVSTQLIPRINEWINLNPNLIRAIAAVAAGAVVLGPVLIVVGQAISGIGTIIGAVGPVIGALTGPIGLVALAVGALYAAFSTNFLGIRDVLQPLVDFFADVIGSTSGGGMLGVLANAEQSLAEGGLPVLMRNLVAQVFQALGAGEQEGVDQAQGFIDTILQPFQGIADVINTYVMPAIQLFVSWFTGDALPQVGGIVQNAGGLIGDFFSFLGQVWEIVGPALQDFANWFIAEGLPSILNFISGTVLPGINDFITTLRNIWEQVAPHLLNLLNWFINDGLPQAIAFVRDQVIPRVQDFINILVGIWETVRPHLETLVNWFITEGLPGIVSFVRDTVIPGVQDFINLLIGIWETVRPHLENLVNWFITEGLPGVVSFVRDTVLPGVQDFVDILEGIWAVVQPGLQDLQNWFTTDGMPAVNTAITTVTGVWDALRTGLMNLWNGVRPFVQPIVDWFSTTFQGIANNFIQPVIDAIQSVIDAAARSLDMLRQIGGGAPTPVGVGLTNPNTGQSPFMGFPGRAAGGSVSAMMPYLVGERGPELFVPGSSGSIVPNDAMGGTQITVSGVTINANSYAEGQAAARGFSEQLTEIMRSRG